MSDTFAETKEQFRRLRTALQNADEDTRWSFGFWFTGIVVMAAAVIMQFGWLGAVFMFGMLLWAAGNHALSSR